MKRTVIGLVGSLCSGKGEVVKHLKLLGFTGISLSDIVREEADSRGIPRIRENLQNIGDDLRITYGGQVLAERAAERLADNRGNIVIDAIRNPAEIEFLRETFDIKIFAVDAPIDLRYRWYMQRAVDRGEDSLDPTVFFADNSRDLGIDQPENGQHVKRCLEMADVTLMNEGSKKHLFEELEYHLILDCGFSPEGARRAQEKK